MRWMFWRKPVAVDPHVKCECCGGPALPHMLCPDHVHHAIGRVNYSDKGERILACDGDEHE